ncbi:TerC family protein [Ramlibacter tataouinensis]|uniref:TerC family protein n=1 Tax=Ramlibacter tataouinensis TaxID=94132 RepID=UPI0022F3C318|nr:TerC family protein [Ramlibacter tataouinensis]WBY01182.1 TerC family protein [Ramlibacter tataouinensis]
MPEFLHPAFWIAVGQIILLDLLLGGDNAVVIALACRDLPPKRRRLGILYGTLGAIGLRVALILFALALLAVPYLKATGGVLLLWIGVKLLSPSESEERAVQTSDKLWSAVRTVILADLVMSMDNVLAIAAAAEVAGAHQVPLVIFGLLVSIPVIVAGSQLVLRLMDRFPVIITLGAMLLGWVAGQMIWTDAGLQPHLPDANAWEYGAAAIGALVVLALGKRRIRRKAAGLAAAALREQGR